MFLLSYLFIFVFTKAVHGQSICFRAGVQCSTDCNSVWFCSDIGANPMVTDDCQSRNLLCTVVNTTLAQCVAEANSNCRSTGPGEQLPIECIAGGLIPDPYNCGRGFICSVQSATPIDQCDCPANNYWNIDNHCGNDAEGIDGCCVTRALNVCPEGTIDGTFGADCLPQYYYVCAINSAGERVIRVLHCDGDQIYDSINHVCIDPPTTTETTTVDTIETITTEEIINPPLLKWYSGGRRWRHGERGGVFPTTTVPPALKSAFTYPTPDRGDDAEAQFSISARVDATCSPYVFLNCTN